MLSDFLIIGGGVAGLSAAARLSPSGSVTLLEAESSTGYHSSGRSAAVFEEDYGNPTVVALNRASRDWLESAHGGVLSPRGVMLVGEHSDPRFEKDLASLNLDEITVQEALDIVSILDPSRVERAAVKQGAKDIDTDLLLGNFAREAKSNGASVVLGARIESIAKTESGWRAASGEMAFEAPVLINAAGAWADEIAAMAGLEPLGLRPYRRSIARIPAPGGHDVAKWPLMFGAGESWYAKPDAGKLLVSPAEEDPTAPFDAHADDLVIAQGIDRYSRFVTTEVTRVETTWAGLRTFAPDRTPVIGFDPAASGFFWLAGQGGYGMQSSPGASLLASELATGISPTLDSGVVRALDPARFRK